MTISTVFCSVKYTYIRTDIFYILLGVPQAFPEFSALRYIRTYSVLLLPLNILLLVLAVFTLPTHPQTFIQCLMSGLSRRKNHHSALAFRDLHKTCDRETTSNLTRQAVRRSFLISLLEYNLCGSFWLRVIAWVIAITTVQRPLYVPSRLDFQRFVRSCAESAYTVMYHNLISESYTGISGEY